MKDLTRGKESSLIMRFALPMLIGNVFQQMYNIVDSIIVGNYLGKEALAAVGASFPIIFALISFVVGISTGASIIISQYFGAKKYETVKKASDTLMIFLFVTAIVISVIGIAFSEQIFRLIDMPAEVIPQATTYFNIYSTGYIFFFGYYGLSSILRGLGDSKTPLYFLIFATIINVILDYTFIVLFKWGIESVAIATIISQAAAFFALAFYLNKTHKIVKLKLKSLQFSKQLFIESCKLGLPSGLQNTFVALGIMALFSIVNSFGTSAAAAYSIASRIDSFASLPAMNFAAALSTFVGQNIGANKTERVRRGLIATIKITSLISIAVSVVAWLFGKELMQLFTNDAEVIELGRNYLVIVCSFYIVFSIMFAYTGVLRGAGETTIPMIITLFAMWFVRVPASYLFAGQIGIEGVWWAMPTGWIIGLVFNYMWYKSNRWKKKKVVKIAIEGEIKASA
ncbi:MAG: MATE family efflux transporter [Hyphomicrobiales bacterium]